jgi:hypothetical protein
VKGGKAVSYFLITVDGGEIRVYEEDSADRIMRHLDKDDETGELLSSPFSPYEGFETDPEGWGDERVLIIKGEVVEPKQVSVEYGLD